MPAPTPSCAPFPGIWPISGTPTSADGHHWQEQGPAIQRGPRGSYDERSVFTPDILAHDGRFYLVYQTTRAPSFRCTPESIAIAVAERPSRPLAQKRR